MVANTYVEIVSQSIPPIKLDLVADKGSDFNFVLKLKDGTGQPRDIAGKLFRGHFRKHYYSTNNHVLTVTVSNATTSQINISLAGNTSSSITDGRYVYDIEMYSGNTQVRVFEGTFTLTPDVTR